jgi:hypothetical protein
VNVQSKARNPRGSSFPTIPAFSLVSLVSSTRILGGVGSEDSAKQVAKTFLEFRASGTVVHLDASTLAADKAGFTQNFEMLGEGCLGQHPVVDLAEVRAIKGTLRGSDFGKDLSAHRIGQGVEETLDRDVAGSRMEEGPHRLFITRT